MARLRQLKLPRSHYKKPRPPKLIKIPNETYVTEVGGTGRAIARRAFFTLFADDLVMASRATHINQTALYWGDLRRKGHLDDQVAVIVDGSPTRPIKNVKLGGVIDIQGLASMETILAAAAYAYSMLVGHAASQPYGAGYASKKANSYSYKGAFEMYVSDKVNVSSLAALGSYAASGKFTAADWVTIHNYVPYAAKLERYRYPTGSFVYAWKKTRQKFGSEVAIMMDYVTSTDSQHNMKSEKGISVPVPQPVLRIGQPGAFPSRLPPMRKYVRDRDPTGKNRYKRKGKR